MHAALYEARLCSADLGHRFQFLAHRTLPEFQNPDRGSILNGGDKPVETPVRQHGRLRGFLKLMVEIDSSRFALSRVRAALVLLAILALFAGLGYGLPALFSYYF